MTAALLPWLLALAQGDPIPIAAARERFVEAARACDEDGGRLWGSSLAGPLLLVDPATRFVVASEPDREGRLVEREGAFVGELPPSIGPANTAIDWAGVRWTLVMWPALGGDETERVRLLVHELFHRAQPGLGIPQASPGNVHLDELEGRLWLRAELRALAAALRAAQDERRAALRDALAFRAARRAVFPAAEREEDALETNEGLAEYTGLALCGRGAVESAPFLADRLAAFERRESFVRSFAYETGPALGFLLDDLAPGWRPKVRAGRTVAALAAEALAAAPAELAAGAEERLERYGGEALFQEEDARAERRASRVAELRARFVDGPLLSLPAVNGLEFTFDPNRVETLGELGNVHPALHVSDAWGVLDVASGGALLAPDLSSVTVKAPAEAHGARIAGEGWTLVLEPGWTLAPGPREADWTARGP
jgi:hypothetical protein